MRPSAVLLSASIKDAMDKTLQCLRVNFRTPGNGAAGWYHYLDDEQPGVTASAVGLYCFRLAGQHFERSDEVLRFLVDQQVRSEDNLDGGWSVRTTHGYPIVESSAWAVRALSSPHIGFPHCADALKRGVEYLERHQNTDFGWGSHRGQPSRVFHTTLVMLALQEAGGSKHVLENARKWLISAQSPDEPAWGCMPNMEPTVFHTSMALKTLLDMPGALPASTIREIIGWLMERFRADSHTERSTTVEEFDVPYIRGSDEFIFQNSLPHFAGPNVLAAVLSAGVDPLQSKILDGVLGIIESQSPSGSWELPRSPTRESLWAIWPFIAALAMAQEKIVPVSESKLTLLFDGCAIIQTSNSAATMTSGRLLRNVMLNWLRSRKVALTLWFVVIAAVGVSAALMIMKKISLVEFFTALILPVLLLIFQLIWGRRKAPLRGGGS